MKSVCRLFVFAEALIYAAYMAADLGMSVLPSVTLKYISIIICLAVSVFVAVKRRTFNAASVSAALLFTLISDTFLLVTGTHITLGLVTFCIVQMLYLFRIDDFGKKMCISLLIRAFTAAGVCAYLAEENLLNTDIALAAFYFIGLVANFAESAGRAISEHDKRFMIFALGLILFICCDICVALNNMGDYIAISSLSGAVEFSHIGMWLFYLPSQVLIVLSAITEENKK